MLALCSTVPARASQGGDRQTPAARRLFLEVERAARRSQTLRRSDLTRLYRDVCPPLEELLLSAYTPPATARAGETAEQTADRLEQTGGSPWLAEAGRRRCRQLMAAHHGVVTSLAREDLRHGSRTERLRALRVIGAVKAVALYDEVIAALREPDAIYAAQALRDLDDPRAIPVLVGWFRDRSTPVADIVRSLQRNRPAHASLLASLQSDDVELRRQAAYALTESRDPALVPIVERLVRDPAADVRRQAGHIGFLLNQPDYLRARPSVLLLLSDPDLAVRSDVAWGLATRHDRACAPALLELVRLEEALEGWRQSNIVQAIQTLTGTYFGLTPGTPSPPDVRQAALTAFAQWIREHP